ncbi:MAG: transposase zinc-binding domain-containing protein [Desulfovibrio sp.]|nr:transposase zinc-binding domain-containing protein [Desulfovibrio sp.]
MAELSQESQGQDYPANAQAEAGAWRQPAADATEGARGAAGPPASLEDSTTTEQGPRAASKIRIQAHEVRSLYCAHCGDKKLITLRCKGRTCPDCRRSEYWRLIKSYEGLVDRMVNAKHAIFTIPNVLRLTKGVVLSLTRSIKKLFRRKFYQERVRGGLLAVELTNIGNGWHPHAHVLLDADFLPQKKLDADWKRLTGGMVHIKAHEPRNALRYLLKYVGKAPDIYRVDQGAGGFKRYCRPEERDRRDAEFNAAMKGLRMVQPSGCSMEKRSPLNQS